MYASMPCSLLEGQFPAGVCVLEGPPLATYSSKSQLWQGLVMESSAEDCEKALVALVKAMEGRA